MGISLAPQVEEEQPDPLKPKPATKPLVEMPGGPMTGAPKELPGPSVGLAPAPMTAPAMTSSVPAPTVAAPGAPVDRVKLASDTFNNIAEAGQGAYDAAQRTTIRNRAALGQIGSGGLRTAVGDLQLARERDLDTLRKDLTLKATEGSIADATTAFQQQLAGSQQGLAEKIGLAGIDSQKDALALQEKLGLGGLSAEQQRIAIAQKQQDIDAKFNAGKMTLAERDAARADLALAQQYTLSQDSLGLEKEKLGIAKNAQDVANKVALGQLTIAQANALLDEKVKLGQLTLAEKNQALAELTQKQAVESDQQKLQLAKDQLEQQGKQFGLSLAQQKDLATIADKTANRSIDVSTAQGKNALLLELARIMGAKDLSSIDPNFLAAIAKSLGVALPATTTPKVNPPPNPKTDVPIDTDGNPKPTGVGSTELV
jgi:hypothetical protein